MKQSATTENTDRVSAVTFIRFLTSRSAGYFLVWALIFIAIGAILAVVAFPLRTKKAVTEPRNEASGFSTYRAANAKLAGTEPGRVVFLGDSITAFWPLETYFPGKPFVNRGIESQTSSQMLLRFQQDVIELHPAAVVIHAGTNDIAGNGGPVELEDTQRILRSMVELAEAHGVRPFLATALPVNHALSSNARRRSPQRIAALNQWIRNYCRSQCTVVDYYSRLADPSGSLPADLSADGVHPNQLGYRAMADMIGPLVNQISH